MTCLRFTMVTAALLSLVCLNLTGCGGGSSDVASSSTTSESDHDHDHEGDHDHDHDGDHDHGDDHAHEHPAHGPNGGHMVKLNDGSEVEVALLKENDAFTVYPSDASKVTKVAMITKIEDKETTYTFEKSDAADSEGTFSLTSPELATAARMGDAVDVSLVITSEDGEVTGKFVLHEH